MRMPSFRRLLRILLWSALGFVVLLGLLYAFRRPLFEDALKESLQAALTEAIGGPVTIGAIEGDWLSEIALKDLEIRDEGTAILAGQIPEIRVRIAALRALGERPAEVLQSLKIAPATLAIFPDRIPESPSSEPFEPESLGDLFALLPRRWPEIAAEVAWRIQTAEVLISGRLSLSAGAEEPLRLNLRELQLPEGRNWPSLSEAEVLVAIEEEANALQFSVDLPVVGAISTFSGRFARDLPQSFRAEVQGSIGRLIPSLSLRADASGAVLTVPEILPEGLPAFANALAAGELGLLRGRLKDLRAAVSLRAPLQLTGLDLSGEGLSLANFEGYPPLFFELRGLSFAEESAAIESLGLRAGDLRADFGGLALSLLPQSLHAAFQRFDFELDGVQMFEGALPLVTPALPLSLEISGEQAGEFQRVALRLNTGAEQLLLQLEVQTAADWTKPLEIPLKGDLKGSLDLKLLEALAQLDPRFATVAGRLQLEGALSGRLGAPALSFAVSGAGVRAIDYELTTLALKGEATAERVRCQQLEVQGAGLFVQGEGGYGLKEGAPLDLKVTVRAEDLTRVTAAIPGLPALGGGLALEASVRHRNGADWEGAQGALQVNGSALRVGEINLGTLSLKAAAKGDGVVALEEAALKGPLGEVFFSGSVQGLSAQSLALMARGQGLDLNAIAALLPEPLALSGTLGFDATVAIQLEGLDTLQMPGQMSFDWQADQLSIGELRGLSAEGQIRYSDGLIEIQESKVNGPGLGLNVAAKAASLLAAPALSDLQLRLEVFDLARWQQELSPLQSLPQMGGDVSLELKVQSLALEDLLPQGVVAKGRLRAPQFGPLKGALEASEPPSLAFDFTGSFLDAKRPESFQGEGSLRANDLVYGESAIQGLEVLIRGTGEALALERLRLRSDWATAELAGSYARGPLGEQSFRLDRLDLETDLQSFLSLSAGGDPLRLRLKEPAALELEGEALKLSPVALAFAGAGEEVLGRARLFGRFDAGTLGGDARLELALSDLSSLGLPTAGALELTATWRGDLERPGGSVELFGRGLQLSSDQANQGPLAPLLEILQTGGEPWRLDVDLELRQEPAEPLQLERLSWNLSEAAGPLVLEVQGAGTLPYWLSGRGSPLRQTERMGAPLIVTMTAGPAASSRLLELSGGKLSLSGAEAELVLGEELRFGLKVGDPELQLDAEGPIALGKELAFEISSGAAGGRLQLEQHFDPSASMVRVGRVGTLFEWTYAVPFDWRRAGPLPPEWQKTALTGALRFEVPELRSFAGLTGLEGFQRGESLAAELSLKGRVEQPDLALVLALRRKGVQRALAPLPPGEDFEALRLEAGLRWLETLDCSSKESLMASALKGAAAGEFGITAPDLSVLRPHLAALARIEGQLSTRSFAGEPGKVALSGSLTEPKLFGRLCFEDLLVKAAREIPTFDRGRIDLSVSDAGDLALALNGRLGYREIDVQGLVRPGPSAEGSLAKGATVEFLTIKGEDVLLSSTDHLRIRADLDLVVQGPLEALAIKGAVNVTQALATQPIEFTAASAPAADPRLQLFSVEAEPFANATLDLAIMAPRTIEVRNNLVRARMGTKDFYLGGTLRLPRPRGAIDFSGMRVQLPFSRLTVTNGTLRWVTEKPYDPELGVLARTEIRGYELDLTARGPIGGPEISYVARPSLSRQDAYLLLTTGATASGLQGESASGAVVSRASGLLTRALLGASDDPDQKTLAERLQVDVGRQISESGAYTLEVEYEVDDPWFLRVERDRFDAYNLGAVWRIRFR